MAGFPISEKLKERFCTDYKIPINIYKEPYFTERLVLLDSLFQTINKWSRFVEEVRKYDNEQAYFEEYNHVKDNAIAFIKETCGYKHLNAEDMNRFSIINKGLPGKDIYKPTNDGRLFISIDMQKANFSTLSYYSRDIFRYADTWEEFMRNFTENKHIIHSKYIRQVILGNCNPKRHITLEKFLMDLALTYILKDELLQRYGLTKETVVFFSNDEIVFDVTDVFAESDASTNPAVILKRMESVTNKLASIPFRFEIFTLKKIKGLSEGYIKDGAERITIKGVDANMYPFVARTLKNEAIEENDKIFLRNGYLCKYIDTPVISIN